MPCLIKIICAFSFEHCILKLELNLSFLVIMNKLCTQATDSPTSQTPQFGHSSFLVMLNCASITQVASLGFYFDATLKCSIYLNR
eukprot:c20814_g1_i3 orf=225-479(+)